MSKIIAVFGATGNQGESVINKILGDIKLSEMFSIRAITTDPSKPKCLKLKDKGVEVIKADFNDETSIKKAVRGVHTVFAVTVSIYATCGKGIELLQGKRIVDAAVNEGVQDFIWSTEINANALTKGKLTVPLFDAKAEIEAYIRGQQIRSFFFAPGSFMQNFLTQFRPQKEDANHWVIYGLCEPDTLIPLLDIQEDTGKFVAAFLEEPEKYEGNFLACASGLYTFDEIARLESARTGRNVKYVRISEEEFSRNVPPSLVVPLSSMFTFINEFGYYGPETKDIVEWSIRQARGELTTIEDFFAKNQPL